MCTEKKQIRLKRPYSDIKNATKLGDSIGAHEYGVFYSSDSLLVLLLRSANI